MVILLFVTTFIIALATASMVVSLFNKPIETILKRIVPAELVAAWARYLRFAIYVVGVGGGVRVWDLEKYLTPQEPYKQIIELTSYRWVLEIYQTIIGTLSSTAIVLLVFFVFALIGVVIVQVFETRAPKVDSGKS